MSTRTIVVTGGSSGIGLAVARRAVAEGWRTVVVDRQEPLVDIGAHLVRCDLRDAEATREALESLMREEGSIDVLVTAAGDVLSGASTP